MRGVRCYVQKHYYLKGTEVLFLPFLTSFFCMLVEIELQGKNPILGPFLLTLFMAAFLNPFFTPEISGMFSELFLIILPLYFSFIVSLLFRRASFLRSEL